MSAPVRAPSPLARALGENVRRARLERGLSAVELAARASLARATLTALEAGRGNPTLETVAALASVLGSSPERLLRHEGTPEVLVVRAGEGSRTSAIATLIDRHAHEAGRTEIFELELPPGARERSTSHGPGATEVVLVRSGRLRAGPLEATVELGPGDYAAFAADCLHEYAAAAEEGARFWLLTRYGASARPT
jgi:transcriptional regulator with XRE-family HTH domain